MIKMCDFTSWFHDDQESRSGLSGWLWLRSYKVTVLLSVLRPQFFTPWAWFHRLPECFHDKEAGFPQSSDPREIERETETERQGEYEQRSKRVPKAEAAIFYNLMSKVTHHDLCWMLLAPQTTSDPMWEETTQGCENQEAGILGGHVGGCQP